MNGLEGAREYLGLGQAQQGQAQQGQGQQQGQQDKVRASHLLIKHSGSRRPASWKNVSQSRGLFPQLGLPFRTSPPLNFNSPLALHSGPLTFSHPPLSPRASKPG